MEGAKKGGREGRKKGKHTKGKGKRKRKGSKEKTMCEVHIKKCGMCKTVWTSHKKLASCENADPEARCPDSLCMYVGNPRRPVRSECDQCRETREMIESLDEDSP